MIIKISVLGFAAMFLALTLKKANVQAATILIISSGLVILTLMHNQIYEIVTILKDLSSKSNIPGGYVKIILKAIGIGYVSEFSSSVIRDSGENALASKIEFAGKLSIVFLAMPLFENLLDLITGLLP